MSDKNIILIIDDDDIVRSITERLVKFIGYKTICAINGLDGVNKYIDNKDNITLILLDIVMPVMDGKEAFYKLKEINNDIKIIIVSGYPRDTDVFELIKDGAVYLPKPFKLNSLEDAIHEISIKTQPLIQHKTNINPFNEYTMKFENPEMILPVQTNTNNYCCNII